MKRTIVGKTKNHGFLHPVLAFLLFGVTIYSLYACSKESSGTAQTTDLGQTDLNYIEDHVSGTLYKGITVDADIPDLSSISSYDIVSAHLQPPDQKLIQSLKDYIFAGYAADEIEMEYTAEDQHTNFFVAAEEPQYWHAGLTLIEYPGAERISITNNDAWDSGGQYADNIHKSIPMETQVGMFTKDELDFMSPAAAIETVMTQLSEWNIQPIKKPEVYCLDYETLLHHEHLFLAQQSDTFRPELGKELDCYFMIFETGYNNIPYSFYEFYSSASGEMTLGASLQVYFTAAGIIDLSYDHADYAIDQVLEVHDEIITLDQAMSQVAKQYEELIVTANIHIPKIYFQYVPTTDGIKIGRAPETYQSILVPAWIIQPAFYNFAVYDSAVYDFDIDSADSETYLDPIVIHAITGQDITYSGKYN